jgi:hypothetical protein
MRNQPGGQFGGGGNIRSAIPQRNRRNVTPQTDTRGPRCNLGLGDLTTIELLNNLVLLHI